jgi:hypothetical protein
MKTLFETSVKNLFETDKLESYRQAFIWWENNLTQSEARAEAKATNNREAYIIFTNGVYTDKLEQLARR